MSLPVYIYPIFCIKFFWSNYISDLITQYLRTCSGNRKKPLCMQSLKHLFVRNLGYFSDIIYLYRRKTMYRNSRIVCTYPLYQIFIPLNFKFWMNSTLKEYLCTAYLYKFFYLFTYLFKTQNIGIISVSVPVKCTKFTIHPADICIVYISIHDKRSNFLGM